MSKRGWHLNALSGPAAVHIACTVRCVTLVSLVCVCGSVADDGVAVDVASRRDVYFGSQGVCGRGKGGARGQGNDGSVVWYVFTVRYLRCGTPTLDSLRSNLPPFCPYC